MAQLRNIFSTRWGIVAVGALIGILATLLQNWGNPGNMGICVACFERDIAGALGLHRADVVQQLRREIIHHHIRDALADVFREKEKRLEAAKSVRERKDDPT